MRVQLDLNTRSGEGIGRKHRAFFSEDRNENENSSRRELIVVLAVAVTDLCMQLEGMDLPGSDGARL